MYRNTSEHIGIYRNTSAYIGIYRKCFILVFVRGFHFHSFVFLFLKNNKFPRILFFRFLSVAVLALPLKPVPLLFFYPYTPLNNYEACMLTL